MRSLVPRVRISAALRWFYLGVSAATLLQQPAGAPFLRGLLQLLEEHQYHFASSTVQNIKAIRARGPLGPGGGASANDESSEKDVIKPTLQRVGGKVAYEYLLTPHLAHALSGSQVLLSLCELMGKVYRKLIECAAPGVSKELMEAVSKADAYLEEHFFSPAAKQADTLAKAAMRGSLSRVDPLFARLWGQASGDGVDDPMERTANPKPLAGAL